VKSLHWIGPINPLQLVPLDETVVCLHLTDLFAGKLPRSSCVLTAVGAVALKLLLLQPEGPLVAHSAASAAAVAGTL
jgi:hypothetical protein